MKNKGKIFEENFKRSVPNDIFYYRFKDGTGNWQHNDLVRFQASNICDCMLFDSKRLYLFELKSIQGKSIPFTNFRDNQLKELSSAQCFNNIVPGVIIEFSTLNRAFFIEIANVMEYIQNGERKSIPLEYLEIEGIEVEVTKLRINSRFNIKKLLEEIK